MKVIEIPYAPREAFKPFHNTNRRFRALVVHRRAGKTTAIINNKIREALEDPVLQLAKRGIIPKSETEVEMWRNVPRFYPIIEPQLKQARTIAWGALQFFSRKIPGVKINQSELSVTFPGNGVVKLFGAGPNESEGLRGIKMWSVDFDEYQDHDPNVWYEIVRPACIDTQAPVTFSGTIKGKNHLYRQYELHKNDPEWFTLWLQASKSNIIPANILAKEKEQYEIEGKLNKFLQEFELEPMAIIEGAIFGKEYIWLKENNRIKEIEPDPYLSVDTYWDLGIADYMVVLFFQRLGNEYRIIDSIAVQGTSLPEVAKMVNSKGYTYGIHYLPHDAGQRSLITGKTRKETLVERLNGDVVIVKRTPTKEDAIQAVRGTYKKLVINSNLVDFIDAFAQYEYDFDERRKVYLQAPKHNWCSHYCDALMQWAQIEITNLTMDYPTFSENQEMEYNNNGELIT